MMPTISQFYGIRIMMHLKEKEHNPPHIHAYYGDNVGKFLIKNGSLIDGDFPKRGCQFVKEFVNEHTKELMEMWETGKYRKLPPIK